MITSYFESEYDQNTKKNIVELREESQRIEFTDRIGEDYGGGTIIEGQIAEEGKVVIIKIGTSIQNINGHLDTTQTHYIDSNLLPRKVPIDGVMLKGVIVVERSGGEVKPAHPQPR